MAKKKKKNKTEITKRNFAARAQQTARVFVDRKKKRNKNACRKFRY